MKTKEILGTLFCLFLVVGVSAQIKIKKENRDRIKSLKIAYITEKLDLTAKEAEKFWPVYNAHEETLHQLRIVDRNKVRNTIREKGGISSLTEKDSKEMLSLMMKMEKEIYETNLAFRKKLISILPHKKILELEYAERGFKRQMFDRLKRKRRTKSKE